jgi:hypothetical protein
MQLISRRPDYSAQLKPLIEQQHGLSLGTFICFVLAYEDFNLLGQQTADGSGPAGG